MPGRWRPRARIRATVSRNFGGTGTMSALRIASLNSTGSPGQRMVSCVRISFGPRVKASSLGGGVGPEAIVVEVDPAHGTRPVAVVQARVGSRGDVASFTPSAQTACPSPPLSGWIARTGGKPESV